VSRRALRLAFLAALAGALVVWAHLRTPRDLRIEVDLTNALPGDVAEVDVIVRREGRALARVEDRYGARGAPPVVSIPVRAIPGPAEVEVTLVTASGSSRRVLMPIMLTRDAAATVRIEP
jgi:hypothetical protein